jgi:hypothetical protein
VAVASRKLVVQVARTEVAGMEPLVVVVAAVATVVMQAVQREASLHVH